MVKLKLFSLVAVSPLLAFVTPAWADQFSFTAVEQEAVFTWSYLNVDGADLSASATFRLVELVDADSAKFRVTFNNTTLSGQPGDNRLTAIGIGVVTPDLVSVSDTSSTWDTDINTNFPAFKKVDFCAFGGSNCSGGSNGGLFEGGSTTFDLTMNFASAVLGDSGRNITFASPFASKWQSVGNTGSSWQLAGCLQGGSCNPTPPRNIGVPEPGTFALAGLAMLGLIGVSRRQKTV